MLNTVIVIRQCLSGLLIISYQKKYTKIWERINNLIGKEFDKEPVYGDGDKIHKDKNKIKNEISHQIKKTGKSLN